MARYSRRLNRYAKGNLGQTVSRQIGDGGEKLTFGLIDSDTAKEIGHGLMAVGAAALLSGKSKTAGSIVVGLFTAWAVGKK